MTPGGNASTLPIFVVGLPRSGTSLIEQILASHPQIHGAGELNLIRDLYRSLPTRTGQNLPGIACVPHLTPKIVAELADHTLSSLQQLGGSATRVVDKMPENYLLLGLIAILFPNARIIHARRDVRDTGLSLFLNHFRYFDWTYDLTDIAERINDYQRLMAHWRQLLPDRILEIDYEALVHDFEPTARRLVEACGVGWDPACAKFHETRRPVRTASMTQVRQPLYQHAVGRWQHYLVPLQPLLDKLDLH